MKHTQPDGTRRWKRGATDGPSRFPTKDKSDDKIIYGFRVIVEAIDAGEEIEKIFFKTGLKGELYNEVFALVRQRNIPYQFIPEERFRQFTSGNHQGIVAYVSPVEYSDMETVLAIAYHKGVQPILLFLDKVTDVRNFGAIARSAECAGVNAIVLPAKGSALINSDAMKTSAGALNHIPVCRVKNLGAAIETAKESGLFIVAATEKAESVLYDKDFSGPVGIIMGSEEKGISRELRSIADAEIKIPINGKTGSLNVSVATAIVLYEVVRQRTLSL